MQDQDEISKKKSKERYINTRHYNLALNTEERNQRECSITGSERINSTKSMENEKPSGNYGLTKEFYETFCVRLTPIA